MQTNVLRIGNVLCREPTLKGIVVSHFDYYLQDALGRHGEKIVIIKIHNNIIEISVRLDFRLLGKFRHFLNKKLGFMEAGTSANARVFWEYADGNLVLMVGEDREMWEIAMVIDTDEQKKLIACVST